MRTARRPWLGATLASWCLHSAVFASAQGTSNKDDSRNCYFPDGVESSGSPCFPDQAVSPCCGPGFICLSNGLCQPGPDTRRTYQYTIYRSSCTDRTWNSTDCPKVCLGPDDNLDSGQGLATCGTGGSYCCGRGYDCCSNGTDIFNYGTAEIVTTIPYSSSSSTSAPASSSASTTSSASSSSSSSSSNAIAIGVGVGVGVGGFAFLLASIIAFLLFRRRKKARQTTRPQNDPSTHGDEANLPRGSELPAQEMKVGANSVASPPPTYRSDSYAQSPAVSSPGTGGGMVPGAPLNPAEFPTGPERERFEMEGQHDRGSWKGVAVQSDGQRHEMEG